MSFGLCGASSPNWNDHKNNLAQSSLWSTNIVWVKAKYLLPTPHAKVNCNKKMKRQQVQNLLSFILSAHGTNLNLIKGARCLGKG